MVVINMSWICSSVSLETSAKALIVSLCCVLICVNEELGVRY